MTRETREKVRIFINGGFYTTTFLCVGIVLSVWWPWRHPGTTSRETHPMLEEHKAFLVEHARTMAEHAARWEAELMMDKAITAG
jgi:hypothetical protein